MTKEQFKNLVESYEKLVFTVCYQLVQDYQEAQNLMQDTFVSAYSHIDTVSEQNLKAWLVRIATNKAKDFLKSAYYRKVAVSEDLSELDVFRNENSPESLYISGESADYIKQAILNLKEPYHKVSILFFLEEKSVDEIARQLCRPKRTVETQIYRARLMLQNLIKEGMCQ